MSPKKFELEAYCIYDEEITENRNWKESQMNIQYKYSIALLILVSSLSNSVGQETEEGSIAYGKEFQVFCRKEIIIDGNNKVASVAEAHSIKIEQVDECKTH